MIVIPMLLVSTRPAPSTAFVSMDLQGMGECLVTEHVKKNVFMALATWKLSNASVIWAGRLRKRAKLVLWTVNVIIILIVRVKGLGSVTSARIIRLENIVNRYFL